MADEPVQVHVAMRTFSITVKCRSFAVIFFLHHVVFVFLGFCAFFHTLLPANAAQNVVVHNDNKGFRLYFCQHNYCFFVFLCFCMIFHFVELKFSHYDVQAVALRPELTVIRTADGKFS